MSKKTIYIDPNGLKELNAFPKSTQEKFDDLLAILNIEGKLVYPFAKKINKVLFEIRVKDNGQFRSLYAYKASFKIVILSAFRKKTQKTPTKEVKKALKRLKNYEKKQ